jgi:monovalent cation/hydrogen antiporter
LLTSGEPFPDRDMICLRVIAVTLLQRLLLPTVVRWARLPSDTALEQERLLAQTLAAEGALAALLQVAAELGSDQDVVDRLRHEYQEHLQVVRATGADDERR